MKRVDSSMTQSRVNVCSHQVICVRTFICFIRDIDITWMDDGSLTLLWRLYQALISGELTFSSSTNSTSRDLLCWSNCFLRISIDCWQWLPTLGDDRCFCSEWFERHRLCCQSSAFRVMRSGRGRRRRTRIRSRRFGNRGQI